MIYRVEHRRIREPKGRFFVGPWSERGWEEFPDKGTAFEMMMLIGEEIVSWEYLIWEGPRVIEFQYQTACFNEKYIAGVEDLEHLRCLTPWWDFIEMAGFCIRTYDCPEEYIVRAKKIHPEFRSFDFGSAPQCAFHWKQSRLIGEVNFPQ